MTPEGRAVRITDIELVVEALIEWGWRIEEVQYTRTDNPDLTATIKVSVNGDRVFELV